MILLALDLCTTLIGKIIGFIEIGNGTILNIIGSMIILLCAYVIYDAENINRWQDFFIAVILIIGIVLRGIVVLNNFLVITSIL